ncbi:MAG: excisionase family DNA-binding protein [Chloroflexota bacterium]|nr:excisionase family DNA-binding protein [Chloroflexota bacterium]
MGEKLLLRPEEAAEAVGIGRTEVFRLIRNGELESVMVGARRRRIPVDALRDYVRRLREAAAAR